MTGPKMVQFLALACGALLSASSRVVAHLLSPSPCWCSV